ncbi:MAG: YbhN family protein [Actinomycetota bacterium]|nr:flippase-like domain-containing protein [Actinomycetota bacterium]
MEPTLSDPEPVARSRGGAAKIVVRIGVGLAVLGFIVLRHPAGIIDKLSDARPLYLALAFASVIAGLFVSALRWRVYLRALDLDLPLGTLFRLYFVGTFFNAFLPTGIGGDGYKAIRLGRDRGSVSRAFASVFLDRFAGIVGLAIIGFVSTLILVLRHERANIAFLSLALSAGIVVAAILVLAGGDRLAGVFIPDRGLFGKLRTAIRDIELAGRSRETLAPGIAYGLVFQLLVLGYHLSVAAALRIHVNIAEMSAIVVIASLATMIPITINGLGFRESSYKWALTQYGACSSQACGSAFAILILAVLLVSSAVGGLVYVIAGGEVVGKNARVS